MTQDTPDELHKRTKRALSSDPSILKMARAEDGTFSRLMSDYGPLPEWQFVIDANVLGDELSYRCRQNDFRGPLRFEGILASGVAVFHAPGWLDHEIRHSVIPKLAKRPGLSEDRLLECWEYLRDLFIWHDGYDRPASAGFERDPDDEPYVRLVLAIGAHGILSRDKDFDDCDIDRYDSDTLENVGSLVFAAAGSMRLRFGAYTVTVLSVDAMSSLVKLATSVWSKIPGPWKYTILLGLAVAFLIPSVRQKSLALLAKGQPVLEGTLGLMMEGLRLDQELRQEAAAAQAAIAPISD